MSSSPGDVVVDRYDEYQRRLRSIANSAVEPSPLLAGVAEFQEWLHPRSRDGKFIKKGGFVRLLTKGLEHVIGRVTGVEHNPKNDDDPLISVDVGRGQVAKVPASLTTSRIAQPKASVPTKTHTDLRPAPSLFEFGGLSNKTPFKPKPPLTFESQRDEINEAAVKLSPDNFEERVKGLNKIMGGIRGTPIATAIHYNKQGKTRDQWTPERVAQHEALWEQFFARVQRSGVRPGQRDAVILGGRPGSGKSTALKPGQVAGEMGVVGWDTIEPMPEGVTHIALNPDSIKEMMIANGMLPEGISPLIKPMEQVSFIHAESNFITMLFLQRMAEMGYPVAYDTTMANTPHMLKNMQPLIENGYDFRGLYIEISAEESRISAAKRFKRDWQNPEGGRFVPSEATVGDNMHTFNALKPYFNKGWMLVDNSGVSRQEAAGIVLDEGVGNGGPLVRARSLRELPDAIQRWKGDPYWIRLAALELMWGQPVEEPSPLLVHPPRDEEADRRAAISILSALEEHEEPIEEPLYRGMFISDYSPDEIVDAWAENETIELGLQGFSFDDHEARQFARPGAPPEMGTSVMIHLEGDSDGLVLENDYEQEAILAGTFEVLLVEKVADFKKDLVHVYLKHVRPPGHEWEKNL